MPQIRKDPLVNRWVIVATERARRPASFNDSIPTDTPVDQCPFCTGKEAHLIEQYEGIRVLHSINPLFNSDGGFEKRRHGLYDVTNNYGAHELVLETEDHVANLADFSPQSIVDVLRVYAKRMDIHRQNPVIEYVLAYKNYGVAAGSRNIGHARSQIMALPVLPMRVKDKITGSKRYYESHERCLMCDLIRQEIKDGRRIVAMNQDFIAIVPFAARFPFEVTVIPRFHHHDYALSLSGHEDQLAEIIKDVLTRYKKHLNDPAYNYIIQTAPFKAMATIQDEYHWHIEIIPRLTRVAGFERGTGFYISPIPSEMAAEYLKEE